MSIDTAQQITEKELEEQGGYSIIYLEDFQLTDKLILREDEI